MRVLVLLIFFYHQASSQDISGTWAGTIESKGSTLPYELVIYKEKEKWKGYALINFQIDGKDNPGIKEIELKFKKNNFILEDDKLVYESFHSPSRRTKLYAVLSFKNDALNILQGSFSTRSLDMRAPETYKGKLTLIKQATATPLLLLTYLMDLQLTQAIVALHNDIINIEAKNEIH